jgi:hypothetical protein
MIGLITEAVLKAVLFLFWLCSVGSLIIGILAICNRIPKIPRASEFAVFAAVWICLVIAGTVSQDVWMIALTVPLVFVCLGMAALLWRSSGSPWGKVPNLFYWLGTFLVMAGAVHFGILAALIQCIDTQCHPLNTLPPRPNVAVELILWSLPAAIVGLGLILSKQFRRRSIAIPVALLPLLNPAILLTVASLHLRLGI